MSTPVLSLRGLSKSYGAVRALVDVDLDIHPHEVVALVGDIGAGKSTLARVVAGATSPDAGTIELDGQPVTLSSTGVARSLGIATVFQEYALCENLDVVENLFLGQELRRGPLLDESAMEKRSWELLNQLAARVPSVRMRVGALSGGQRQAVAIARALLGDPRLVVLDEPTASLGISQTAELLNLVERLRVRGHGVLLISHSMVDVQAVADRIVVLRLGRINGDFDAAQASYEDLLAAITGVTPSGRLSRPATDPVAVVTPQPQWSTGGALGATAQDVRRPG
ncbi:ABC transporter ATP-binding protein [Actinomycetota bacterium]|nr:ABC transporter ATP-binding protein [Actinomycetota bacterium]